MDIASCLYDQLLLKKVRVCMCEVISKKFNSVSGDKAGERREIMKFIRHRDKLGWSAVE